MSSIDNTKDHLTSLDGSLTKAANCDAVKAIKYLPNRPNF